MIQIKVIFSLIGHTYSGSVRQMTDMRRWQTVLLMLLAAAAIYLGGEAAATLESPADPSFPSDIYAAFAVRAEQAACYLRPCGNRIAIYATRRSKEPTALTDIDLNTLRSADLAMVRRGIPVSGRSELLMLLEDLGS